MHANAIPHDDRTALPLIHGRGKRQLPNLAYASSYIATKSLSGSSRSGQCNTNSSVIDLTGASPFAASFLSYANISSWQHHSEQKYHIGVGKSYLPNHLMHRTPQPSHANHEQGMPGGRRLYSQKPIDPAVVLWQQSLASSPHTEAESPSIPGRVYV